MKRGRIISALMLIVVASIFGGVYQFYFKQKLEEYAKNAKFKDELRIALEELETHFQRTDPDAVIRLWSASKNPWADAAQQRTKYFKNEVWTEHETHPDDGSILRFWYDETSTKMVNDLYTKVYRQVGYQNFPQDIRTDLRVPYLNELQPSAASNEKAIYNSLARLSYGISACELLLEHKVSRVDRVILWPIREDPKTKHLMKLQTLGLSFAITMADFIDLLEDLRLAESYFTVDAIEVTHPSIGYQYEPQLNVRMVLTQANYLDEPGPGAAPGAGGAGGAAGGGTAISAAFQSGNVSAEQMFRQVLEDRQKKRIENEGGPAAEPGFFGKMWKLFKRYVLVMN